MDKDKIKKAVTLFLEAIGEDPERKGLIETPDRVMRMCDELFRGYNNEENLLKFFETDSKDVVLIRDIKFNSTCEHHLLPFFGTCDIAYIPQKKVLGLSKFARIVGHFSARLQLQEKLTRQIHEFLKQELDTESVMVKMKASHMCMQLRGVKNPATTLTLCYSGEFDDYNKRMEILNLL